MSTETAREQAALARQQATAAVQQAEAQLEVQVQAIESARASLQRTAWLGANAILCVPGVVDESTPYEVAHENARASLDELRSEALRL